MVRDELCLPDLRQGAPGNNPAGVPDGPDQAGTVAELYAGGDLPERLVLLIGDSVGCENTGALVKLDDPARLTLWPWSVAAAGQ